LIYPEINPIFLKELPTSELFAIDGLSTSTVVFGEITTLKHELGDHTMKPRSSVAEAILTSAELTEVTSGFRDYIVEELEDNSAGRRIVDGDVELVHHFISIPTHFNPLGEGSEDIEGNNAYVDVGHDERWE